MRLAFTVIFSLLATALAVCAVSALKSKKTIGPNVAELDTCFIPPVIGNMLIIASGNRNVALFGYYIYFLGMNAVIFSLARFSAAYCKGGNRGSGRGRDIPKLVYALLAVDTVQLLLNPFFGQAFAVERMENVYGYDYWRLVPKLGQAFHRIVDYGILVAIIAIFVVLTVRTSRLYREKYSVMLISILVVCGWESFYIFSRSPIDRGMIGLGMFGLGAYYFALVYRPRRLLDRMLSDAVSESADSLFIFDPYGKCIWANATGCRLLDMHSEEEFEGAGGKLMEMFGDPGSDEESGAVRRVVGSGKNARYYSLEEVRILDEQQKKTGSYLRVRDITEEELALKRKMHDATHDRLTGLYTREYLYAQIAERLASDTETLYYAVFLNVKDFKVINDVFGNEFGDFTLRRIAKWLNVYAHVYSIYGRLGGDTFGTLVRKEDFERDFLERELGTLWIEHGDVKYHVLVQLGVYEIDRENDKDISVMFDRAHLALSTIRDEFKSHIAFYDNEIRSQILWNQEISTQLGDAIEQMQLRPYLQPIADGTGKVVGAEALARWIHPEHGFLAPYKFIPVFEKNGMIVEVDKHMWRCACQILARWKKTNPDLFISVNISPKDFYFVDVVAEIEALVKEYDIDPSRLRIEITETVMMNDAENRMAILEDFRQRGFIVEMDDFGSGYSSLNMLKDMPVDVLKIDMKFLGKTSDKAKAQTIVKNILNLSKELGIISLTEGVETQEHYEVLREMGCVMFQGYFFAKPMPVDEFESFAGIEAS